MNSLTIGRLRAPGFWAGAVCSAAILGFVACSGNSEHITPGSDCPAGNRDTAGETSGGQSNAGPRPQAGDGPTGAPLGDGGTVAIEAGGAADNSPLGSGGQPALGGQAASCDTSSSTAGQASGGEASGGGGGEPSVPPVDPICGANMAQVGAYSLWCGKVNMHQDAQGDWVHDADCTSGCDINGIGYCQKFYPNATTVVAVDQTASVVKDWKNAGCADSSPDGKGISGEAVCCAPLNL